VDKTGKYVLVANYSGGSVAVFPYSRVDDWEKRKVYCNIRGRAQIQNVRRAARPLDRLVPDNRFAIVADLGLDQLDIYRFDSTEGSLVPNHPAMARVKPGAGVRHFAFIQAPDSDMRSTKWTPLSPAFPTTRPRFLARVANHFHVAKRFFRKERCGRIQVHPMANFSMLESGTRQHRSFLHRSEKGTLTPVEYCSDARKAPRYFAIDQQDHACLWPTRTPGTL